MELGRTLAGTGIVLVLSALSHAAFAGEFSDSESGKAYEFTRCVEPTLPDLSVNPSLKGRIAQRAINRSIGRYNDHVERANAYLQCISGEAGDDLDQYYKAVTATFNAKQDSVIGEIETMRVDLGLDEDPNAPVGDPVAQEVNEQLLGGETSAPETEAAEPVLETVADELDDGTELPSGQILPDLAMEPVGN